MVQGIGQGLLLGISLSGLYLMVATLKSTMGFSELGQFEAISRNSFLTYYV